jgi:hypothetical protein
MPDLSCLDALLLKVEVFFCNLAEGPIEDRHIVLDAETDIDVLIEGSLLRGVDVRGLKGNRFVSILLGKLDAAVSVAVLHVRTPEDDKSGLKLVNVGEEGHEMLPTV